MKVNLKHNFPKIVLFSEVICCHNSFFKIVHCFCSVKIYIHLKFFFFSFFLGEKPFKCLQCTRSFVSSGVLKAHIRTHTGLKAYKCLICDSTFTTNGSLKRHMSTHSEVRPFMCPYCQKTFKTSVNCKKHMKTHRYEGNSFQDCLQISVVIVFQMRWASESMLRFQ